MLWDYTQIYKAMHIYKIFLNYFNMFLVNKKCAQKTNKNNSPKGLLGTPY